MISQREIWWADLGVPIGSAPGYRRPVLILQADWMNRSQIRTVICVPLTTNIALAESRANVMLPSDETGLPHDSVANLSQVITIDRRVLLERVGKVSRHTLETVFTGIDVVLGR